LTGENAIASLFKWQCQPHECTPIFKKWKMMQYYQKQGISVGPYEFAAYPQTMILYHIERGTPVDYIDM